MISTTDLDALEQPAVQRRRRRTRWADHRVIVEPLIEPVSWDDVKDYVPIDDAAHQPVIDILCKAARRLAEWWTGRAFIEQTIDVYWDEEWWGTQILLPRPPVTSVSFVESYSRGNVVSTLATSVYRTDTHKDNPRLILNDDNVWPTDRRSRQAMRVRQLCGYGTSEASVPDDIRVALRQMVGTLFENPVAMNPETGQSDAAQAALATVALTPSVRAILSPYRDYR